jgi:hypothetical protein
MEPISTSVVAALAAGALAVGKEFATDAVKGSYAALKKFVLQRFSSAAPFVEAVEEDPQSADEQRVLAKRWAGLPTMASSAPWLRSLRGRSRN